MFDNSTFIKQIKEFSKRWIRINFSLIEREIFITPTIFTLCTNIEKAF